MTEAGEEKFCRYCFEDDSVAKLISPCDCKGKHSCDTYDCRVKHSLDTYVAIPPYDCRGKHSLDTYAAISPCDLT